MALSRAAEPELDADLLRLLVDSVKDYAIFMLDPTGRVASWNLGAQRLKGYLPGEIIGRHFSAFYPKEDVEGGKCELELEVAAREGRFEDEGWRVRKDGTMFWANVVITALRDTTGALRGFGKVTRDLTARVQAENERLQRARAEAGDKQKEEFLAIMGHELRNPLSPMFTAVHLLKLRRGVHCEHEIAVLDRQLAHMRRLLDDLLDVSRILRDQVTLTKKPTDIGAVLANAVDVSAALIERKQHMLRLDVPKEPLVVDADTDRLTQVFANLLNNAAKYTDEGGEIRVRADLHDGRIRVVFDDTGIGIAKDDLPRIFDLFTQAPEAKERALGGFGVGLAVVKRLLLAHGGEITVASDGRGQGSRFTVTLPRSTADMQFADRVSPSIRRAPVSRRVLIVDDNEDSSDLVAAFLSELGHQVTSAIDGPSALELAKSSQPEIAFLDIGLPGMNGFEVARKMREIPACAAIPIIAVSGYARDSDRREALEAGFTQHFAKPLDLGLLEKLVDDVGRGGPTSDSSG